MHAAIVDAGQVKAGARVQATLPLQGSPQPEFFASMREMAMSSSAVMTRKNPAAEELQRQANELSRAVLGAKDSPVASGKKPEVAKVADVQHEVEPAAQAETPVMVNDGFIKQAEAKGIAAKDAVVTDAVKVRDEEPAEPVEAPLAGSDASIKRAVARDVVVKDAIAKDVAVKGKNGESVKPMHLKQGMQSSEAVVAPAVEAVKPVEETAQQTPTQVFVAIPVVQMEPAPKTAIDGRTTTAPIKAAKSVAPVAAAKGPVHASRIDTSPAVAATTNSAGSMEHGARMLHETAKAIEPNLAGGQAGSDVVAVAAVAASTEVRGATLKAANVASAVAQTSAVADAPADTADAKTLVATGNILEIGVSSGTHGWLRVRAELGQMGEVTASMVASSAGAVDSLHRELPAMSAYLRSEAVGVSSLVVHATGQSAGTQDAAQNFGAQAGTSGRGRDSSSAGDGRDGNGSGARADDASGLPTDAGFAALAIPAAVYAGGSGSWLSVRV